MKLTWPDHREVGGTARSMYNDEITLIIQANENICRKTKYEKKAPEHKYKQSNLRQTSPNSSLFNDQQCKPIKKQSGRELFKHTIKSRIKPVIKIVSTFRQFTTQI